MNLSKAEIDILNNAINGYSFPCVCYDFNDDRPLNFQNMKMVEEFVRKDLKSGDYNSVKNGLSNVLYWGFAQIGYRDTRVEIFRKKVTEGHLHDAAILFERIEGVALKEIWKIRLPQFSSMSFISKIRMFLDPANYVILDQQILKINKAPFLTVLKNVKFGDKETQIRISNNNIAVYQKWCRKCKDISVSLFKDKYRAVDIERAFFTLIQRNQAHSAAEILSKV